MSKKLLVKDLKRDEIADDIRHAGEVAIHWTERHRGPLIGGTVGLLIVALAWGGFAWNRSSKEDAAETRLAEAMRMVGEMDAAAQPEDVAAKPKPTWEQVVQKLEEAVAAGPGSPGSKLARLQLGYAQLRLQKPTEAVTTLQNLADEVPDAWLAPHALAALSIAQEQAGDVAAAEATLKKLGAGKWEAWPPSASLMLLAEFYERQKNIELAKETYKKLSSDATFASTPYAPLAKQKLTDLGS